MSIKPRDFSRDITVGGEIQKEREHWDRQDKADTWIRTTNNPYGENAPTASPAFNPVDSLIPAKYNQVQRGDNWKWYNAHKPSSYELTDNEPGIGVDPNLEQVGNSPFWVSSNEPVDPTDCERWPNSPYCGGSIGNPFGTVTSAMVIPSSTSCETCITYQPNFLGIPGPVSRVCYRKDNEFCKVPIVPEANEPPAYPPGIREPRVPKPIAPPGYVRFLYCCNFSYRRVSANVEVTNYDIDFLNEGHRQELDEIYAELMAPYSDMVQANYRTAISHSFEPGIIRCDFELFSTTGPRFNSTGGVNLFDYVVLPWELNQVIPKWVATTVLEGYRSHLRLRRTNGSDATPGFVSWARQEVDYPPLHESTGSLSGGIEIIKTVSESYDDYSIVWCVDVNCSQAINERAEYTPIAEYYREQIERIARPNYSVGNGIVYLYDSNSIGFVSNEPTSDWLKFVQIAASDDCPIPSIEPTLPKEDDSMDCCEEVLEQLELLQIKNSKVYRILGGDRWFKSDDSETPDLDIDAETAINTVRSNLYRDDSRADSETVSANDLISLIAAYQAVLYQRSGFHRFPAIVPENLALDPKAGDDPDLSIVDAMSWQEWLVKQLDGLLGAWPIKVKYKDEEGEESEIELHNSSEAIAEMYGLLLSVAGDVDIQTELGFKAITEAIAAKVAATTAADYAKGNAEFLGYKGNLKQKKIPTAITPGAKTLKKALETSEQKVPRWENEDKLDLVQLCTRILFAAEVVKSVFWDTLDPERGVRGGGIKDLQEQGSPGQEESWQQFLDELRNPTGVRYSDLFPKPDINNLPQEERDGN